MKDVPATVDSLFDGSDAHQLRKARTAPKVEPDGFVLIRDTKNSPMGYWFIGAYRTRDQAKADKRHNPGSVIRPFHFTARKVRVTKADQPCKKCDGRGWYMVTDGIRTQESHKCECATPREEKA